MTHRQFSIIFKDMTYIQREILKQISNTLHRGKSILLLGPRQTGKTTLVRSIEHDLYINLMNSKERLRYESNPGLIIQEISNLNKSLRFRNHFILRIFTWNIRSN